MRTKRAKYYIVHFSDGIDRNRRFVRLNAAQLFYQKLCDIGIAARIESFGH